MKGELVVVKSNELINACFRLNMIELRIIYYMVALANPIETKEGWTDYYELDVIKIADYFSMDKKNAYRQLKTACDTLFDRQFTTLTDENRYQRLRFVDVMGYQDKEGYLGLKFSSGIKPYITELESNFTQYNLGNIANFSRVSSVRLYEIFISAFNKQINKSPSKTIKIELLFEDIIQKLQLTKTYHRIDMIKKHIVHPALDDINKHTDLKVKYEVKKKGRKHTGLMFSISKKTTPKQPKPIERPNRPDAQIVQRKPTKPKSTKELATGSAALENLRKNNARTKV